MTGAIHCEWGLAGALAHAPQSAAVVVVDVLSFSTAVDIAVERGAEVYPFASGDRTAANTFALQHGAEVAGRRGDGVHRFNLSPTSLVDIPAGTRLVLPSPNGSAISAAVGKVPLFAGCLRNARAVAAAAQAAANGGPITVIAAGEHWPDGRLRPAIEDLIGAGAILSHLTGSMSPEASIAGAAYRSAGGRLADLLRDSVSGRELIDRGWPGDVEAALHENASTTAPLLRNGRFVSNTGFF